MKLSTKCLFIIFLLYGSISYSQNNIIFEQYHISDGLSNNSINAILQTSDGFLWIATKDGLNRFDGQNFKTFKHHYNNSSSLKQNYVMSLLESKDSLLWIGTWGGGLLQYDPQNEIFISYSDSNYNDKFIQCIYEDKNENIWFGTTEGGLFMLNRKNHEIRNFGQNQNSVSPLPTNNITHIYQDVNGFLWLSSWESGLLKFNPETYELNAHYLYSSESSNTISSNGIWHLLPDTDSTLIICTFSGCDKINIHNGNISANIFQENQHSESLQTSIRQAFIDSKDRLWIGSYDYCGLFLQIDENKTFHRYVKEDDNELSISIDRIRCIYEDMKGNIWIGTENGLNKIPALQPFKQYKNMPRRESSLGGRVVSSICQSEENTLWVGFGGGGMDAINLTDNSVKHFKHDPKSLNTLSSNDITHLYRSSDGILWVSTMNGGLNRFNPKTMNFQHFNADNKDPSSICSDWVLQTLQIADTLLLVGTNEGLDTYNPKSESFSGFQELFPNDNPLPPKAAVNALFQDKNGIIWIGTWLDGLFSFNPETNDFKHFIHEVNNPGSISSNKISVIYEDTNGMWFGTHSGGLNLLKPESESFIHYNTHNGLPNDVVFGLLSDSQSNLWISTMNGLAHLNTRSGTIRVYKELDGLINNQFNWRAYYQDSKGNMYFGGINGLISFHSDSIIVDTTPPPVAITSITVFNKKTGDYKILPANQEIILDRKQNFFSIEFNALDMAPVQNHEYSYILEGIESHWVNSGTRNIAYYTNIHHGSFNFKIKAANADGYWSKEKNLAITILPAWWNTWWAKLAGLFSVFGIGILVARVRFWYLVKLERIRLNISRDLHDEMGSNLSSISVDSQQLMLQNKENPTGYELASDIYKTTQETMSSIRDIIWFINPKNDGTENMLLKIREIATVLLAGINWSLDVTEGLKLESIPLAVRRNIFLIYKESLTNIVRHSKASQCHISISRNLNQFQLLIKDNGIGFEEASIKQKGGLTNLYYRAKKIHGILMIDSKTNNGTSISLTVPVKTIRGRTTK